jgi:maleylacetate reductase
VILCDPELVATLPAKLTVTSGLNAMAHAVEALYARDANPLSDRLAFAGIRAFKDGLPRVVTNLGDLDAREATLLPRGYVALSWPRSEWRCITKLCHTLGERFNLPHAETHAILLPHSTAHNAVAAAKALASVGEHSVGLWVVDFAASQSPWALLLRCAISDWSNTIFCQKTP